MRLRATASDKAAHVRYRGGKQTKKVVGISLSLTAVYDPLRT